MPWVDVFNDGSQIWFDDEGTSGGIIFGDSSFGGGETTAYDRGDAVRAGTGVGAAVGLAVGVATGVTNAGGVGSISGGFIGGSLGGWVYDAVMNGDGSAVLGDGYNAMGDYGGG